MQLQKAKSILHNYLLYIDNSINNRINSKEDIAEAIRIVLKNTEETISLKSVTNSQLVTNVDPKYQIAQWVISNRYPKSENDSLSSHEMFYLLIDKINEDFIAIKEIDDVLFFARNDDNLELEKDGKFYNCDDYDGDNPILFMQVYENYLLTK